MKMYSYTTQFSFIALLLLVSSARSRIDTTESISLLKEIEAGQKALTGSTQSSRIWPLGLMGFSGIRETSPSSWVRGMIDRLFKIFPLKTTSKNDRVTKIHERPSIPEEEKVIEKPQIIGNFAPRQRVRIEIEKSLLSSDSEIRSKTQIDLDSYLSELEQITHFSSKPIGIGFEGRLMKTLMQIQAYEAVEEDVMRVLVREANSQRNQEKIAPSEEIEDPVTVNRMIILSIISRFDSLQLNWLRDGLRQSRESLGIPRQVLVPGTKKSIEVDRMIEHIIMLGKTIGGRLSQGFHAIEKEKVNVEKEIMRFPPEQIALISAISQDPERKSRVLQVPLSKTAFDIAIARMTMTNADSKLRSILKVGKQGGFSTKNYELLIRHLNGIEDLLKDHEELSKISKNGLPILTWLGDNSSKGSIGKLNQEIWNVVNQVLQQTDRNPIRMLNADELKTPQ